MRRLAGIVADERPGLVGERPDDSNLLDFRLQRKKAIILEKDHRLICKLARVRAMFSAVQLFFIDLRVSDHFRRIEHAESNPRGEEANECGIESALGQISLLNGIDIGFLDGIAEARSEGNALVVHATND